MRPIQTGWAEMPRRTKTIAPLSMTERGFTAESTPIGIETSSQRIAPPKTSEAVTGAADSTMSFTSRWLTNDRPSETWKTRFLNQIAYCSQTGLSRFR